MRISLSTLVLALGLPCFATTAFAQDELAEPEAGDVGAGEGEVGGDVAADGDAEVADAGDAGGPAKPISVGLLLGYGISLEDGPNPWGLGFGVRGGYNLDQIYLGARFVYYLGESEEFTAPFVGTVEISVNIWELGIEGGYDLDAGGVTVRPGLGLGIASINSDSGGGSASSSEFYLAPGVSALFDVSDDIFIGAEARFKFVLSDPSAKAITLLANGGMRF